jgi:hypothetical protein
MGTIKRVTGKSFDFVFSGWSAGRFSAEGIRFGSVPKPKRGMKLLARHHP